MPLNLFLQLLNNSSLKRFKSFLNPISPDKTIRENFTDHQPVLITLFFVIFYVVANFIFISLFEALLLDNFDLLGSEDFSISDVDITLFRERWIATGVRLDQAMDSSYIQKFVMDLDGAFGLIHRADPYWFNRVRDPA